MTTTAGEQFRRRQGHVSIVTYGLGAAAWAGFALWASRMRMGAEPGTMGLGIFGFIIMWMVMMVAMMLPAVAPLMSLYARSVAFRPRRLTAFGGGYVVAWSATGVAAFALASLFSWLAANHGNAAHALAVTALAVCGIYQLTPVKRWCLRHCRSPLGHLLVYANYKGPTRDLRAGLHHGLLCIGCCWMLMVALVVVGVMNLPVMLFLAALIALEKRWRFGEHLAKLVGVAALVLALAVGFDATLAPGLHRSNSADMDSMEGSMERP